MAKIKIDMNIIRNLHSDSIKHSLVKSLVIFCQDANIKLIAEGIETPEELSALILRHELHVLHIFF